MRFYRLFEGLRPIKKWVQFRSDGLCIVTRILGIPVNQTWYDRSQIYGFGYAANGHSGAEMLQFCYAGDGQVILARYVKEYEVKAFLDYLHREGFAYEASRNRPAVSLGYITSI